MNTPKAVDSPEAIADDRRRIRRKALWLLFWGSPVLFVILFYTVENWRGARAWKKCQEEMAAKGEKLDYASFIPPKISDEENFAAAPIFTKVLNEPGNKWTGDVPKPSLTEGVGKSEGPKENWMLGETIHLPDWQSFYSGAPKLKDLASGTNAAGAILRVLGRFDPILEELRNYSSRPLARYPLKRDPKNPFNTTTPHLAFNKGVVTVLCLRSRALLDLGNAGQAFSDINLMLRICKSHEEEAMLIPWLVSVAEMDLAQKAVWEGMQDHQWTEAQLQHWQKSFGQLDQVSTLLAALRAERAAGYTMLNTILQDPGVLAGSGNVSIARGEGWILRLVPTGWFRMEQVSLVRIYHDLLIDPIQKRRAAGFDAIGMMTGLGTNLTAALSETSPLQVLKEHRFYASLVLGGMGNMCSRAARAQTMAQLTATACALERHRLATGGYPETLDELLPGIKADLIQKGPPWEKFKYRKRADGRFLLYSVGLDQKDDGGEVIRKGTTVDFESGDLVWPVAKPLLGPEKKAEESSGNKP